MYTRCLMRGCSSRRLEEWHIPVKCACKDEIVVCANLIEAIVEVLVVDQAAGLIDDDEGEDSP